VSLLHDLVQKLNVQDKPSHPPTSSQRTFNRHRRNFQAHRNFENPKNPNPSPGVNFVGKNHFSQALTVELVTCLILRILAKFFAQYVLVFLGSDRHEDHMVNMTGELHDELEDSREHPYASSSEIQSHNRGVF
jgi:hypothetical protein